MRTYYGDRMKVLQMLSNDVVGKESVEMELEHFGMRGTSMYSEQHAPRHDGEANKARKSWS